MGYYATTEDIRHRLIPFEADHTKFSDTKIDELIDYREAEIDGLLKALGYAIPVDELLTRDIALLKQKVINAVVADILLMGYILVDEKKLQDARDLRQEYKDWLKALADGNALLVESTTNMRDLRTLVIDDIDLNIDEEDDDDAQDTEEPEFD